jgi:DMSO/TMAO reductase YedYZ heme-binding membrane subunit
MRDVIRGVVVGVIALALAGAVAARLDLLALSVPRAGGTAPWLLSRVSGVTAFVALALDVIIGLFVSTRLANRVLAKGVGADLHRWLSPIALALVLGHAALLLADGYIRFDAIDVLVPLASPYRPVAVGIGVIAAYLALVVHGSFALRKRIGARNWRRLHYLSFVALAGAALHALLAGTDSSALRAFYAVPLGVVVALIVYRIAVTARSAARGAA